MPAEIRVFRSLQELEEVRAQWIEWPGNRDSDLEFFLTILRANKETVRPHVIAVFRDGRPDAILVGRIDQKQMDFRVGYAHLRVKSTVLYFVYGAHRGVASKENCELLLDGVRESLGRHEADVAYLNYLDVDSSLYQLARTKPGPLVRDYVHATQPHFSMTIPTGVDEFYSRFSPKVRKNQKWQARKLEKDFSNEVKIRTFRKPDEVPEMMQHAESIAKKSYQRGLGVGFVENPEMRERMLLKAERGWLRASVLYVKDQPCAFWIADVNGETFGSEYTGYDPELAKYSPGMYLINHVIEGLCRGEEPGLAHVDFASGHAQYKELLSTREWQESAVHIFAPTPKGIGLNIVRCVTGFLDQGLKRVLERTQLLSKLKKAWRSHAAQKQFQPQNAG